MKYGKLHYRLSFAWVSNSKATIESPSAKKGTTFFFDSVFWLLRVRSDGWTVPNQFLYRKRHQISTEPWNEYLADSFRLQPFPVRGEATISLQDTKKISSNLTKLSKSAHIMASTQFSAWMLYLVDRLPLRLPGHHAAFWDFMDHQIWFLKLWREITLHYKDQPWAAGCSPLNEPPENSIAWSSRCTKSI